MLTIASFVLRHKRPEGAETADYARDIISDFLIYDMPLVRACEWTPLGSLYLPKLVWNRSLRDGGAWSLTRLLQTELHYRRWEFSRSLVQAVRRGDRGLVVWLMDHFEGCPISNLVIETAAGCGHLWLLQLLENDKNHGEIQWRKLNRDDIGESLCEALNAAAKAGHWNIVRWLDKRVSTDDTRKDNISLTAQAILRNEVRQLKWALKKGFAVDFDNCRDLCEGEWNVSQDTIRYLVGEGFLGVTWYSLENAAEKGDLEFVKWLVTLQELREVADDDDDENPFAQAAISASEYGRLDTVKWLLGHIERSRIPYDSSRIMFAAAMSGNLDLVKWLYDKFSPNASVDLFRDQPKSDVYVGLFPCNAMDVAALRGHLDVIKFFHEINQTNGRKRKRQDDGGKWEGRRSPWATTLAIDCAAQNGHLDVIKWLHSILDSGCTSDAMDYAAANGHKAVVKWLHENCDEGSTSAAMDRVAAKKYHAHGSYYHSDTGKCCKDKEPAGFKDDQLRFLQWLYANCSVRPSKTAMDKAAANGNLRMVQWLHENTTAGCSHRAMASAAGCGQLDVVKWLFENRKESRPDVALDEAAACGEMKVVKWLLRSCSELDTSFAIAAATRSRHFDIVLVLHHHKRAELDDSKVDVMKAELLRKEVWDSDCFHIRGWLEEQYPTQAGN